MAAFDTPRAAYSAVGFAGRIGQVFVDAMGGFAAWNDTRQARNSLSKLTDRELNDIGLCRGDIDDVSARRR